MENNFLKLSIITPVYNGQVFIEECLRNVIEQICSGVEHIIIDGGSADDTVEIIKKYADKYHHIRWISEKDQGQSDAMNKGIGMAKGAILGFLNADDFYEPGVLSRALELFKNLVEPSLVFGNYNVWNDRACADLAYVARPKNLNLTNLIINAHNAFPANPSAYFYHTSLHEKAGMYDKNEHYAMDLDFMLRAVKFAHVHYVDELWGNWRCMKGTKTFERRSLGCAWQDEDELIRRKYFQELSLEKRFCVIVYKIIYRCLVLADKKRKHIKYIIKRGLSRLSQMLLRRKQASGGKNV